MSSDSIVIEIFYPHPVSKVWKALSSAKALEAWLMPNDFKPEVGHRFSFHGSPQHGWNGTVNCEVLEIEEQRRIVFSWQGDPLDTIVSFTIESAEGGTNLRLEHTGFAAGGQPSLTIRDMLASGWNSRVLRERLPEYLASLIDETTKSEQ